MRLSALKVKQTAIITKVNRLIDETGQPDLVAVRLESLGFVPGTQVQVITKGVFGGDPIDGSIFMDFVKVLLDDGKTVGFVLIGDIEHWGDDEVAKLFGVD